jgi:hypothetical protein
MVRGARRVHPALRHRRPRWVRAADAADEVRGSHRPLWLSTLDAISTELVSDSLVHRYKAAASPDGLEGDEATFPLCSFCTSPRWRVPVASMRPASRHLALIRPVLISAFVDAKYAEGRGIFRDGSDLGALADPQSAQASIADYTDRNVDAVVAFCEYVHGRYGRFLGNFGPLRNLMAFQAHHLDLEFYDRYYRPGAYEDAHREHFAVWHGAPR